MTDGHAYSETILEIKDLKKYFPIRQGFFSRTAAEVKAVDGVSFNLDKGRVLGIVGESGCGKSTLVNVLLKLEDPTAGEVHFDGKAVFELNASELRGLRKDMQIVFQDPFWSLNPRLLVRDIVGEPLVVHTRYTAAERLARVTELMQLVGLDQDSVFKYPHEFSGGERQRIAIARAIALSPKLVILDEPTSAIDIRSQSQILDLLNDLKAQLGLTYILISHDLGVVHDMSDTIIVMYLGKIVEQGPADTVFSQPAHPYTVALFDAIPDIQATGIASIKTVEGQVPSAINPPPGCRFHTRCQWAWERCRTEEPLLRPCGHGHAAACHLLDAKVETKYNLKDQEV